MIQHIEKTAEFDKAIAVNLTRPEIDIPVVRMIIPGMECYTMDPNRAGYRINGMWPPAGNAQ